tara:strand:- start:475 stop:738 length:264 start_codon:yes stop_codon:yes gene_type:complete
MKTTVQLNDMYSASQSKALKAKLRNVTRPNMKGLVENLLMAMDKLDIEIMLSDMCDNDIMLTATLYEKRVALGNLISSIIETQNKAL